jgi:hypothetical protein
VLTDLLYDMHGNGKERYRTYVEAQAEALVDQHWQYIESVAQVLLAQGEIVGDLRAAFPQRHPKLPPGVLSGEKHRQGPS